MSGGSGIGRSGFRFSELQYRDPEKSHEQEKGAPDRDSAVKSQFEGNTRAATMEDFRADRASGAAPMVKDSELSKEELRPPMHDGGQPPHPQRDRATSEKSAPGDINSKSALWDHAYAPAGSRENDPEHDR